MSFYQDAEELREIARKVIATRPDVAHVALDEVLFLRDLGKPPKGVKARCYNFNDHPIQFLTPHRWGIVVYEDETFYFSAAQMALLIYHELKHIPRRGTKLVDHTVKDFAAILGIGGVDWCAPGEDVPDILGGFL